MQTEAVVAKAEVAFGHIPRKTEGRTETFVIISDLWRSRTQRTSANLYTTTLSKLGNKTDRAVGSTVPTSQLQSNTIYTRIMSSSN